MKPKVISVSPFRCRMWALHDRLSDYVTEQTCKAEIESFLTHGQLVPVLGRPLVGEADYEVELIYGARRLFVGRHLNKPMLVELRHMSDRDAIVAMDIENRHRADLSPYERGVAYSRWLQAGHFKTQEEVARALKVSAAQVSRLLKLARLPAVIIDAFQSPLEICENWGLDIAEVLDDSQRRAGVIRAARAICSSNPRPPTKEVYMRLVDASSAPKSGRRRNTDEVVKDDAGKPLFRIRYQTSDVAVLLPRGRLTKQSLSSIRDFVCSALVGTCAPAAAHVNGELRPEGTLECSSDKKMIPKPVRAAEGVGNGAAP